MAINKLFCFLVLLVFPTIILCAFVPGPTTIFCPGPTYKTVYQPLKATEGDMTDWIGQAALVQGTVCDTSLAVPDPPWNPCPYRGDCPHYPIDPNGVDQFVRHDTDILSFWGFNDNNYLNFAFQVYFFNRSNLCPPGQTIYGERNVCYIAGLNELAQQTQAYFRACINATGTGPLYNNTNGVCPLNYPVDFQFWAGVVPSPVALKWRAFFFNCNANDTSAAYKSFKEQICDKPIDTAIIQGIFLTNNVLNPSLANWVYELPATEFGVLTYDPNLYGSYIEVRIPLSMFGVVPAGQAGSWLNRTIFFEWQTGMTGPGYIQKHCPDPGDPFTRWYIPLQCELNPTGLNLTTGVPITYFPYIDCNATFHFPPAINVNNQPHDPWPGEPPAPASVRTFCTPQPGNLFNCSYLGNNTLTAGTQACCNGSAVQGCSNNDPRCLGFPKDILGVWMITDGTYLYIRIDAPIGYNFSIDNNAYLSICFDVPGFTSGNAVAGDCGAGSLREADFILYYTQGKSIFDLSGTICPGGAILCSLPGATIKNCSVPCNAPDCCSANWYQQGYSPFVTNLLWCPNCAPSPVVELGIPLATLGFNGSVGAVFNFSVRFSNQGLTPNVQYPSSGSAQVILPCLKPPPSTTGTTGIPLVMIGTYVWFDTNYNGLRDAGEPVVPNVLVSLAYCNGSIFRTTSTNLNGQYLFTNVLSGADYEVIFSPATLPAGDFFTKPNVFPDTLDSDVVNFATGQTSCFNVPYGQNHLDADAGLYATHCIGDYVWFDANFNGLQDAGEPGVSGIPVTLRFSNGSIAGSTVTNGTGYYLFCGLFPDNYTVSFQLNPATQAFTPFYQVGPNRAIDSNINAATVVGGLGVATVNLIASTDDFTIDAGIITFGCIGDRVWYDTNTNGQRDAGEAGVGGVTVYLYNGTTLIATTTTNSTGYYLFCGLYPSLTGYTVTFVLPSTNYVYTNCEKAGVPTDLNSDACIISGRNGSTPLIPLLPGQTILHNDAGIYNLSCIGDLVFLDSNTNGIQNGGEGGISGINVTVSFCNGTTVGTTTTNANGLWSYCGLYPNNYNLTFGFNSTYYQCSPPLQGGNTCLDSDITNCATRTTTCFTVDVGINDTCHDTGLYPFARIGDFVWNDLNSNGLQTAGEPGLPGLRVDLLNATTGLQINQTTTNANGFYIFNFLNPGSYRVRFYCPAGFVFTTYHVGANNLIDSDANFVLPTDANALTPSISLPTGGVDLSWDAGCYQRSALGDFVWADLNANGRQDAGEPGVSINITLQVVNASGAFDFMTTTSNSNGFYLFSNLYPSNVIGAQYKVVFNINPIFYKFTVPFQGTTDLDSNAIQVTPSVGTSDLITLPAATTDLTIDAGLIRLAQTTGTTGTTGINIVCFACPFGNFISSFNLVTFDNLTMLNSDIEGRVAVGGSANLDNTGVGFSVSSSSACLPVKNPALATLVVQRRLQKNGGGTWGGNIYYGLGSSQITSQVYDPGCFAYQNATAFNWTNIQTYWIDLSNRLLTGFDFPITGSVGYNTVSKTVTLVGQTSTNREVFFVDSSKIPTGGAVTWNINLPLGVDTVIINVNGTNINFNSAMAPSMEALRPNILWNFYQATNITINGAFSGSILAPYAHVNAPNGLLYGQVFVRSWTGPLEVHYVKFTGCIPFISLAVGADPTCVS